MNTNPPGQRKFGLVGVACLIAVVAWSPAVWSKLERYRRGPGEYMELDLILEMLWMGAWSLAGVVFCAYAVGRAEQQNRSLAAPALMALLNVVGFMFSVWWFCR